MRTISLVLFCSLAALPGNTAVPDSPSQPVSLLDDAKEKPAPKRRTTFTIGKDTTYVDGPIDKDGRIEYAVALNKKLSKDVTPQNNAVVLLWKAHGPHPEGGNVPAEFFTWLGIEAPPEKGDYFIDLARFVKEKLKIDPEKTGQAFWDKMQLATDKPWTAKAEPNYAAWLKANEKPLALVVEASKRPRYFSPLVPGSFNGKPGGLISSLMPSVQKTRSFAQALTMRAMMRLGDGDHDGAWQDLLACHRLGRLVAGGGTLIEGLVGIAVESIACKAELVYIDRAKPSAKKIDQCLSDLKKLPAIPLVADKVDLGERFMFLDVVMMMDRDGIEILNLVGGLAGGQQPGFNGLTNALLGDVNWDPALRTGNLFFNRMGKAMRGKDRAARQAELSKIETEIRQLKEKSGDWKNLLLVLARGKDGAQAKGQVLGDILVSLLMPALSKVQSAGDRCEQINKNLELAFILAKYHRDNSRYPEKLDALVPKYLERVPDDVFSGRPLIYRVTDSGYAFYSVGANGKDEGGRTYGDTPPGDDLGVRMPPR